MMIMARSFAEAMGVKWPRNVARIESDKFGVRHQVTWDEVHDVRRDRQQQRLRDLRRGPGPHVVPCYVWVFYVSGDIYMGWWCYVVTINKHIAINFRGFHTKLATSLMREIPVGFLPLLDNFDDWMEAFAERHPRRSSKTDPRKAGSFVGWLQDGHTFMTKKIEVAV